MSPVLIAPGIRVGRCVHQRTKNIFRVLEVAIGALDQQQANDVFVTRFRGEVEGRVAVGVLFVDVRTPLDQQFGHVVVSLLRSAAGIREQPMAGAIRSKYHKLDRSIESESRV